MNSAQEPCRVTVNGSGNWVINAPGVLLLGSEVSSGGLSNSGDLVARSLEVNSSLLVDSDLRFAAHQYGGFTPIYDDGLHFYVKDSTQNRNIIITDYLYRLSDHDHDTGSANPTLFIHSVTDPDTDNTQWISATHDQTNGRINTGKGALCLGAETVTNAAADQIGALCCGYFEANDDAYFEGPLIFNGPGLTWTSGPLGAMYQDATMAQFVIAMGSGLGRQVIITDIANRFKDHDHDAATNPRLYVHSATDPDSDNTEWASFFHGQEHAAIEVGKGSLILKSVETGITASTQQAQGYQYLTRRVSQISTCANAGDNVTLPTATPGLEMIVINDGAEDLDVYPYSSDYIDDGAVNAAKTVVAGGRAWFVCWSTSHWSTV